MADKAPHRETERQSHAPCVNCAAWTLHRFVRTGLTSRPYDGARVLAIEYVPCCVTCAPLARELISAHKASA
jgi:hypothetical protein